MGRQRNRPQKKEQENYLEEELDEMKVSNLSDRKFRVIIIRILNSMKRDKETIKKGHLTVINKECNI